MSSSTRRGPLESRPWPETLESFAVDTRGPEPRLHGYAVATDLARNYGFSDVVYLALTGDLPGEEQARAFEQALILLAPAPVNESPIHATVLAAYYGASPATLLAAGAVTLADQSASILADLERAERWDPKRPLPDDLREPREPLGLGMSLETAVPILARSPRRDIALVALLRFAGLTTPLQLAAAFVLARLPVAVAEAAPRQANQFVQKYPVNSPPFVYEEP